MIEEEQRLDELRRYDVLDTEREAAFDRVAELAAIVCGAPMALVSLVDEARVWHKTEHGIALGETARERSFCADAIHARELHVVEDALADARFRDYPAVAGVHGIRFYAGAPLVTPRGLALGTLCVLDRTPRRLGDEARRGLELLRDQLMTLLEERRELLELRRSEGLRQEAVEALVATKADLERRVELRTREAESARQRVEQILARVADGFVALDRQWRYIYVNERAAEMFGRTPRDLVGKHIWTEFPNGVGQPFHVAYERAMREQVPITITEHYAPWNRWFENRIYPSPEGVTIFFTELTEQRQAERALEETARRLNEAQAVAHVGSWEWSVASNRVVWSDEMFRIYGLSRDKFEGSYEGFLSHVHAEDLAETKAVIGRAYQQPAPFVYDHRIVRPDGTVRMLHTRGDVVTDGSGRVERMVGSCWDTTERWLATVAREEAAAEAQMVLDTTSDGILVVGGDGRIRRANARLAALLGVAPERARAPEPAAPLFADLAHRLADGDALLARVAALSADASAESRDTFRFTDGTPLTCASRPFRERGRVWSFARSGS